MLCARCGASNPAESTFCGGCGAPLTPTSNIQPAVPGFSEQVPPAASPFGPNTLFQAATPVNQDAPTLRAESDFVPPQPTPSANALFSYGTPAQNMPGPSVTPPGFPGEFYAGQMPTIPASPSGASYPALPPMTPASPSGASYPAPPPAMPSFYSGATYPVQEVTPGGAAYPAPPSMTPAFSSGAYPPATPDAYPDRLANWTYPGGQPSQPGWGGYPGMVPQTPVVLPSKYIQPLPLWVTIVSSIIGASVLAALMFFTGPDWAAGAQTAGIVALVLGLLVLTAFGIRCALGMLANTNTHRRSQIISAIVLAVLLFGYGVVGVTQFGQDAVHTLQGHTLEGQQQWQNAIDEYQAGHQGAPSSTDMARTYTEWGQHLLNQSNYQGALDKFTTVITNYTGVTEQVTQAQQGAIQAYQSLGKQAAQQSHYDTAVQQFSTLLNQTYCNQPCQTSTSALEATAYFNLAEQKLSTQDYTNAVNAFRHLTSDNNLKHSPEATRVHGDYAKALLGEGKQALATTCASAVPIYQQLAKDFSDTPEGQQAAQALSGPVTVKGHFTAPVPPASTVPFVFLGTKTLSAQPTANEFASDFTNSPHMVINSDGTFMFTNIQPGSYQFVYGTLNNTDNFIHFVPSPSNTTIGQLCYSFGDINNPIPTA